MKPISALSSLYKSALQGPVALSFASTALTASLLGLSLSSASAAPVAMPTHSDANSELVNRGAYVARQADCMGCHKEDYSGGIAVEAPMGTIYGTLWYR